MRGPETERQNEVERTFWIQDEGEALWGFRGEGGYFQDDEKSRWSAARSFLCPVDRT